MKTLLSLILFVSLLILLFQIAQSNQLDDIEDHVLIIYDSTKIYCQR